MHMREGEGRVKGGKEGERESRSGYMQTGHENSGISLPWRFSCADVALPEWRRL